MKPFTKEFNALKTKLNNVTITKGKIMVDENDFQNPVVFASEPNYIDIDGYVINNEYNNPVVSSAFSEEFLKVRNEFEENLKLPEIDDFKKYVNDIYKTYCKYESEIVEEDDGSFNSNFIKFEDCDPTDINSHLVCNYSQFLEGLKRQLRDEIVFFHKYIQTNKNRVNNLIKVQSQNTSFQINQPYLKDINIKLKEFKEYLEKEDFISPITLPQFKKVFTGQAIEQPICWLDKPTGLYYLIKSMHDKKIILPFKNYWQVCCSCFISIKKNELTSKYIQRNKKPTSAIIRKLDSAISYLE